MQVKMRFNYINIIIINTLKNRLITYVLLLDKIQHKDYKHGFSMHFWFSKIHTNYLAKMNEHKFHDQHILYNE